jgi:hypothetical protein
MVRAAIGPVASSTPQGHAVFHWSFTETSCTIGGVEVMESADPNNNAYVVQSPAFSYPTAEKDNVLADDYSEP